MPHCLSHDWNIIPVIYGIILRVQRDPEEVSLEICAAKTQHRASKYSKDYSGISSSASNRTHSFDLFLHWLPTKTQPGNLYLEIPIVPWEASTGLWDPEQNLDVTAVELLPKLHPMQNDNATAVFPAPRTPALQMWSHGLMGSLFL